jgi:PhnB protein
MPADEPGVIPMLAYENGPAAMDWLAAAFGFEERDRRLDANGRLSHGEMKAGEGVIMLATPSPHYEGPRHHRQGCAAASKWSEVPYIVDGVLVYVGDLAKHFQRAKQHGALILSEPQPGQDGRRYRAEDLEGHRWMFVQRG